MKVFSNNRFQRVVLNGQSSSWTPVYAGVPQGSILGPLFFPVYINDFSKYISSTVQLFADDTSIFSVDDDVNETIQEIIFKTLKWYDKYVFQSRCISKYTQNSKCYPYPQRRWQARL